MKRRIPPSPPNLLKPDGPFSPEPLFGNSNLSDAASAEKAIEPVGEQKPPRDVHGIAWALVVLSILSSTFLFALDNTIVADVQPAIVERFDNEVAVAFRIFLSRCRWHQSNMVCAACAPLQSWHSNKGAGGKCMVNSRPRPYT